MSMATAPATNADRYRLAAKYLARAVANLRRAHAALTPDGDELPFAGQVGESLEDMTRTEGRLREYATNNW